MSLSSSSGDTSTGDDGFDNFLTLLKNPTTTNVQHRVLENDADNILAVPYAAVETDAEEEETMSVMPAATTKSDNEFDNFLAYLEGGEFSMEVDDSMDDFLSYLQGGDVV